MMRERSTVACFPRQRIGRFHKRDFREEWRLCSRWIVSNPQLPYFPQGMFSEGAERRSWVHGKAEDTKLPGALPLAPRRPAAEPFRCACWATRASPDLTSESAPFLLPPPAANSVDVYSAAFTIHECPQFATRDIIAEAFRVLKPVRACCSCDLLLCALSILQHNHRLAQGGVFIMCDNDPKSPVIQARTACENRTVCPGLRRPTPHGPLLPS